MKKHNININAIKDYPAVKKEYNDLDKKIAKISKELKELKSIRKDRKIYLRILEMERDEALEFLKEQKKKR